MKMKTLENAYNKAIHAYIQAFCKKQEIDFDFWVGDQVGGMASFNDWYHFDFLSIKYDIDTDQPAGLILIYFDDSVEYNDCRINYESYCRGLRPRHVQDAEREKELAEVKERLANVKEIFENELANYIGHA